MYSYQNHDRHGHNASRHCHRCDKELTDAASLECGIGPICGKLDNKLLAQTIPMNLAMALSHYSLVNVLTLDPETILTFTNLEASLIDPNAFAKTDWRKEVKQIEWMLSFGQTFNNKGQLHDLVLALGYVGIVSLWNGEAATGEATVWFNADRLFVCGPQNKAARTSIKKITGWKHYPNNIMTDAGVPMDKPSWSVPMEMHERFYRMVVSHYPNHNPIGPVMEKAKAALAVKIENEALAKLKAATEAQAKVITLDPPPVAAADPVVTLMAVNTSKVAVVVEGQTIKVRTPYNVSFIATLKNMVPYTGRKWNFEEKVWEISIQYRHALEAMLVKFFPLSA
jgi:hypothetical protein